MQFKTTLFLQSCSQRYRQVSIFVAYRLSVYFFELLHIHIPVKHGCIVLKVRSKKLTWRTEFVLQLVMS